MLKKAGVGDRDCIQNFVVKVALWKMEEPWILLYQVWGWEGAETDLGLCMSTDGL
jgi:hypothetical protein